MNVYRDPWQFPAREKGESGAGSTGATVTQMTVPASAFAGREAYEPANSPTPDEMSVMEAARLNREANGLPEGEFYP